MDSVQSTGLAELDASLLAGGFEILSSFLGLLGLGEGGDGCLPPSLEDGVQGRKNFLLRKFLLGSITVALDEKMNENCKKIQPIAVEKQRITRKTRFLLQLFLTERQNDFL